MRDHPRSFVGKRIEIRIIEHIMNGEGPQGIEHFLLPLDIEVCH